MLNLIKCPKCGEEIEVSEALSATIKEQLGHSLKEEGFKEAERKFKSEAAEEAKILKEELLFKTKKLDESREAELLLRQEKLKLEDEKKSFELEKQKQIEMEREKIRVATLAEFSDTHRLRDMEKDKMLLDMKTKIEDLQQKVSQGSQQLQGEVQELDMEEYLRSSFPFDDISPVEKGVRGADIRQTVRTNLGNPCGVILWESKRTKAWSDDWASKLKEDLRSSKANIPIIVTSALPKTITTGFGLYEGVWVSEPKFVQPIAEVMRLRLIEAAREKFVSQNRADKSESLYNYVVSHEFRQQVENIVEVYQEMQEQITKERAAFEKIWKARETQTQRLLTGTAGIIGSMQGIVGQSLPPVKGLDLLEA